VIDQTDATGPGSYVMVQQHASVRLNNGEGAAVRCGTGHFISFEHVNLDIPVETIPNDVIEITGGEVALGEITFEREGSILHSSGTLSSIDRRGPITLTIHSSIPAASWILGDGSGGLAFPGDRVFQSLTASLHEALSDTVTGYIKNITTGQMADFTLSPPVQFQIVTLTSALVVRSGDLIGIHLTTGTPTGQLLQLMVQ